MSERPSKKKENENERFGNLTIDSNWIESEKRPLQEGEYQFFHSTWAYNISPEQYKQITEGNDFVLDRRTFVDRIPQVGYGLTPNPEARKFKENPDELILFRIITKDVEPFTKIQEGGLDLSALEQGGFTGGPEPRFDPKFLGYNLHLIKICEERLEGYSFAHRVVTYEVAERMPLSSNK